MDKAIPFEKQPKTPGIDKVLGSGFYMSKEFGDGSELLLQLTGEEVYLTHCPGCGVEFSFTLEEFAELITEGDLYGTSVLCESCARASRAAQVQSEE